MAEPVHMSGGLGEVKSVSPKQKRATELLEKGIPQDVELNMKCMLDKTVLLLGAKKPPEYCQIQCGGSGYKYVIKFQSRVGEEIMDLSVEGMECESLEGAEVNAVFCAFNYIREVARVRICDFSSRVVTSFAAHNTASSATEALEMVKKIIDKLDIVLWKCRDIGGELERKVMRETISNSADGNSNVYMELSKYLMGMVKSFSVKLYAARNKLKKIEEGKVRCEGKIAAKRKEISEKVESKAVLIPSKGLLDMVLIHFGFPRATYYSSLHRSGMVKSVVQFRVPYIDHLKLCGVVNVKALGDRTARAEEKAAFEAMLLIEQNFRVKIVDINHVERDEAEESQKRRMELLGQIIEVGEEVKELWDGVIQSVNEKVEENKECGDDGSPVQENIAMRVCYEGLVEVVEVADNCYSESWNLLCKLKKIKCNLFGSKLRMGMIKVPYKSS